MKRALIVLSLLVLLLLVSAVSVFGQGPDDPLGVYARQTANAAAANAQNAAMAATAYAVATRQALSVQQTQTAISAQQTMSAQNAQAQATRQEQSTAATAQAQSAVETRTENEASVAATTQAINAEKSILSAYATATQNAQSANATATAQAISANATQQAAAPTQTLIAQTVLAAQQKESRDRALSDLTDFIWKIVWTIVPFIALALGLWGLYLIIHGIGVKANTVRDASGMPATMMPNFGGMVVFMPGRAGAPVVEVNSPSILSRARDWVWKRGETNVTQHAMLPDVTRRDQARAFMHAVSQGGKRSGGWSEAGDVFDDGANPESRIAVVEDPNEVIEGEFWEVLERDWKEGSE